MAARYSKGEEIANTSTHAVGIMMGVVIGVIFIVMSVKGGDAWAGWSIGLYLFGKRNIGRWRNSQYRR